MFLTKVYRDSKGLFVFFLLFISGQLFFTVMGIDNWPFINWGMYSAPASSPQNYEVLIIEINDRGYDYHENPQFTVDMLLTPIWRFHYWERYDHQVPFFIKRMDHIQEIIPDKILNAYKAEVAAVNIGASRDDFIDWMKRYLEEVSGEEVDHLRVVKTMFTYTEDNSLISTGYEVLIDTNE